MFDGSIAGLSCYQFKGLVPKVLKKVVIGYKRGISISFGFDRFHLIRIYLV
jgi:hypothetical protein